jgi:hypothetical protein
MRGHEKHSTRAARPATLPIPLQHRMSPKIKCPPALVAANPALVIQTAILKAGSALTRFHGKSRAGNIYNPNTGKRIEIEEEGARFNPFPGDPAANVPTLYAADNLTAAVESCI